MAMKHDMVVEKFLAKKPGKGSHFYSDGRAIYSYGPHFPIAMHIPRHPEYTGPPLFLYNGDYFSSMTTNHQYTVTSEIPREQRISCTTQDIKDALKNPYAPITISRFKELKDFYEVVREIEKIYKKMGIKGCPKAKIRKILEGDQFLRMMRDRISSDDPKARASAALLLQDIEDKPAFRKGLALVRKLLQDSDDRVKAQVTWSCAKLLAQLKGGELASAERVVRKGSSVLSNFLEPKSMYIGAFHFRYNLWRDRYIPSSWLFFEDADGVIRAQVSKPRYSGMSSNLLNLSDLEDWDVIPPKDPHWKKRKQQVVDISSTVPKRYGCVMAILHKLQTMKEETHG